MARNDRNDRFGATGLDVRIDAALKLGARVTAAELVELIRLVNPTGLSLPRREMERRYRLKSHLQSALVSRFATDVAVTPEVGNNGVVLLSHRTAGDAAHAIVAELDEEARSIVQRRLDEEAHGAGGVKSEPSRRRSSSAARVEPPADEDRASDTELIRLGREAIDEYDYDAARSRLERALRRSGGVIEAALPLLELLVDTLGADEEALALAPLLSNAAASHPHVRARLALAAVRHAEATDAVAVERHLRGLDSALAAPIAVAWAERALRDGDDEAAAERIGRARELGGVPAADLVRVGDALEALRRQKWAPADRALVEALAAGNVTQVEAEARVVLGRWPDAPAARRVLATIEQRRREHERAQLLKQAEEALGRVDLDRASSFARAAHALGAETSSVERAIAAAMDDARRRHDDAQLADFSARASRGVSRDTLLAFLELPNHLRTDARRASKIEALDWIEQLHSAKSGGRIEALADAVLALAHAAAVADPDAVLLSLSPHEVILDRLASGRDAIARARAAQKARQRDAMVVALDQIGAALGARNLAEAARLLTTVDLRALDTGGRERARALDERLQQGQAIDRHARMFGERVDAGDLIGALVEAEAGLSLCAAEERNEWLERRHDVGQQLRREWCYRRFTPADVSVAALSFAGAEVASTMGSLPVWHSALGGSVIVAEAHGRWLFVWDVDAESRSLRSCTILRTPESMGHVQPWRGRETLWLTSNDYLLALDNDAFEVRAWCDVRPLLPAGHRSEAITVLPDADYAWIEHGPRGIDDVMIVDLKRWRVRRSVELGGQLLVVAGPRQPLVVLTSWDGPARVFDPSGVARTSELAADVEWVALHPESGRLLSLVRTPGDSNDEAGPLALVDNGADAARLSILESSSEMPSALLTSLARELTLVAFRLYDESTGLRAFVPAPSGPVPAWELETSRDIALAQDFAAQRAFFIAATETGLAIDELHAAPPALPGPSSYFEPLPSLSGLFICAGRYGSESPALDSLMEGKHRLSEDERRAVLQRFRDEHQADAGVLMAVLRYMPATYRGEHFEFIEARFPGHLLLALARTHYAAEQGDWAAVARWIDTVALDQLPRGHLSHYAHLAGIVKLRAGDVEGARTAWNGAGEDSMCNRDVCVGWLDALAAAGSAAGTAKDTRSRLAHAILAADGLLARGDFGEARRVLERPDLIGLHEGQSTIRLVAAWMEMKPATDLELAHKAAALAHLCGWTEDYFRREVVVPGAQWEGERVAELVRRAGAWLEENVPEQR